MYKIKKELINKPFIPLTRGQVAIVDDEDYDKLMKYNWNAKYYPKKDRWDAQRGGFINGKHVTVMMHREVLGLSVEDKSLIDHINSNGLDNRKYNLRTANNSQNCCNRRKPRKGNLSGFKGVSWSHNKWQAIIMINYKQIFIGRFDDKRKAAIARDKASLWLHKEFASLNFPELFFNAAL